MKSWNIIFCFLALVSCSGHNIVVESEKQSRLSVSQKTVQNHKETCCSYLLFNSEYDLDASSICSADTTVLWARLGWKTLFGFMNVPDSVLSTVSCVNDLSKSVIDLRNSGLIDKLDEMMWGSLSFDLSDTQRLGLELTMKRYACRICLRSITNNLEYPLMNSDVCLSAAFLLNPPAAIHADGNPAPESGVLERSNSLEVSYGGDEPEFIPIWDTVSPERRFLNLFPPADGNPTYFVVCAEIDGIPYYYHIELEGLSPNESYAVNLSITRLGSLNPDIPVRDAYAAMVEPYSFEDGPSLVIEF